MSGLIYTSVLRCERSKIRTRLRYRLGFDQYLMHNRAVTFSILIPANCLLPATDPTAANTAESGELQCAPYLVVSCRHRSDGSRACRRRFDNRCFLLSKGQGAFQSNLWLTNEIALQVIDLAFAQQGQDLWTIDKFRDGAFAD